MDNCRKACYKLREKDTIGFEPYRGLQKSLVLELSKKNGRKAQFFIASPFLKEVALQTVQKKPFFFQNQFELIKPIQQLKQKQDSS